MQGWNDWRRYRAKEFARGMQAYDDGVPFDRKEGTIWKRGWLARQKQDKRVVVMSPPAYREPEAVVDIRKLDMMRRGGGNRSGTTGGKTWSRK